MRTAFHRSASSVLAGALALASCSAGGGSSGPGAPPVLARGADAAASSAAATSIRTIDTSNFRPRFTAFAPGGGQTVGALTRSVESTAAATLPAWSGTFGFGGTNFTFTMLGSHPYRGSATTTIPTQILPIDIAFSDGIVIHAETVAAQYAQSPIFENTAFPTGTGQYADILQRANFDTVVQKYSPGYHLLLGKPVMLPAITIHVPDSAGFPARTRSGLVIGLVDIQFINDQLNRLIAARQFDPRTYPMLIVGDVFEYQVTPNYCCIVGFHSASPEAANQLLVYMYAAYNSPGIFSGGSFEDITAPSHEVFETVNDPLVNNIVPPWGFPNNPAACASDVLEVGDPIEVFANSTFPVQLNGKTYHPQDEAFYSWFAHQAYSSGVGRRYSYIAPAKLTAPPAACM